MGNKKHRVTKGSSHRHVYCKKKGACRKKKVVNSEEICSYDSSRAQNSGLEGSRIINLGKFQEYIGDLQRHSSECEGSMILCGETRNGFASILESKCSYCQKNIAFDTSKKVKGPKRYTR